MSAQRAARLVRLGSRLSLVLFLLLGLSLSATLARALPTTVFAYNHDPHNPFDNNVEGYIWAQLGLLDANGNKMALPESQIIRDAGNNIIGYRSADGTKEAYNLNSSATAAQAWLRVDPNGTFHIAKEGAQFVDEEGGNHDGGGIQLDGGQVYNGFGTGTGVGYVGPGACALPARPGANIFLLANGCYTANDPDGGGPMTSVQQSAITVIGVTLVSGHTGKVYAKCGVLLTGGTPAQRLAALNALREAARAANFPPVPDDGGPQPPTTDDDIVDWIGSWPFDSRYQDVQDIINAHVPPPGTMVLHLTYLKQETPARGAFASPVVEIPPQDPFARPWYYNVGYAYATIGIDSLSLAMRTIFNVHQLAQLPAPIPVGKMLGSPLVLFEKINADTFQAAVHLRFGTTQPAQALVRWYNPGTSSWSTPQGVVTISPGGAVDVKTKTMGVYTSFVPLVTSTVPTLSTWGLIVLALLTLGAALLFIRRSRIDPQRGRTWRGIETSLDR